MTLLELLRDLTYGEFQQLEIGNLIPEDNESEPDPKDYAKFMSHTNLGLTEIYKRFLLSSKEIYIQQYEQLAIYDLHSKYAASNTTSTEPIKYIEDTAENPFQDDILKIEQCYDELGNVLFLNDPTEALSIFTPSYRSIQIPWPNEFNVIAVQYRADHPTLVYTRGQDPAEIEIAVPNSLKEALIYYIASRAFGSLGGDQGTEGNDYWQKFNASVAQVGKDGLYIQTAPGDWRFDQRGWV